MKHQINVKVFWKPTTKRGQKFSVVRKVRLLTNGLVRMGSVLRMLDLAPRDLMRLRMENATDRLRVPLDLDAVIQRSDILVLDSEYDLNLYVVEEE